MPHLELAHRLPEPVHPPDDRARFEQIVARHHRRLRQVAVAVTGDPDAVEDVLQEAYYRAYRRRRGASRARTARRSGSTASSTTARSTRSAAAAGGARCLPT